MKNNITYTEMNGIFYPDLALPEAENLPIGKYGSLRLAYLKSHRRGTYTTLLTECKLNRHLYEIDTQAREMVDLIISQMSERENVTEALKATNPLEWASKMNAIKQSAEEFVLTEVVYQ